MEKSDLSDRIIQLARRTKHTVTCTLRDRVTFAVLEVRIADISRKPFSKTEIRSRRGDSCTVCCVRIQGARLFLGRLSDHYLKAMRKFALLDPPRVY